VSVTSSNLIQGPAVVYIGAFGATEPATVATAPAEPTWEDVGGTQEGITAMIADTYTVLSVDQIVYEVERRRSGRVVTVKTVMAEATLENVARAINNTAPASNVMNADDGLAAFKPSYSAILFDGIAPGGFRRRCTFRKMLATDSVESAYKKDGMTLVTVTWTLHWVSPSIAPFKYEDAVA
jgi:hypothetical protein